MLKVYEDLMNQPPTRVMYDKKDDFATLKVEKLDDPPEEGNWIQVEDSADESQVLNSTTHKLLKSLRLAATMIFLSDSRVGYKSSNEVFNMLLETVE